MSGAVDEQGAWLVAVAMPQEGELVAARLEGPSTVGGRPLYRGRVGARGLWLLVTGMGLVNAAQAVTAVLERLPRPAALLSLGCAGAYPGSGLEVGAAAVAREVVLADHGVRTQRRLHSLEVVGIPLARDRRGRGVYHRFPCDPGLVESLAGGRLATGTFATVVQVSGDPATAAVLARRWGAVLEDMESAALAQLALHYRLPFAALRGVSNLAGRRELDLRAGAEAAQRALLAALGEEP